MATTTERFTSEKAPCGQMGAGERFRDRDEQCLLSDELFYDCGCKRIRHEYHDGCVSSRVVHHNGKVLEDELLAGQ